MKEQDHFDELAIPVKPRGNWRAVGRFGFIVEFLFENPVNGGAYVPSGGTYSWYTHLKTVNGVLGRMKRNPHIERNIKREKNYIGFQIVDYPKEYGDKIVCYRSIAG